jgi:hypothetical protein
VLLHDLRALLGELAEAGLVVVTATEHGGSGRTDGPEG